MVVAEMRESSRTGIFEDVASATNPGPELPASPSGMRGRVEIAIGAMPDPNPLEAEKLRRQRVALNVAGDVLLRELRAGRITQHQFQAGREFEAACEAAAIGVGGAMGERSTGRGDHEALVAKTIDRAAQLVTIDDRARKACGRDGAMLLRWVLGDRMTFAQIASARGKRKGRASAKIGDEFREALAALVDA